MKRTVMSLVVVTVVALLSQTILAAGLTGQVLISGAQDGIDLAKLLTPAFTAKNPGVRIVTELTSTAVGLEAVKTGKANLASTTRAPRPEEGNFRTYKFGNQPVAVIVNASNPVKGLSTEQVRGIFAGDIMNWSEVGGPDMAIEIMVREVGSTPRSSFEALFMGDLPLSMDAKIIGSKAALTAEVGKTPASISFSTSALTPAIKALAVDGVNLSDENVESGAYKATMPLLFVYAGEPTPPTNAFLDFVASDEGKRLAKGK